MAHSRLILALRRLILPSKFIVAGNTEEFAMNAVSRVTSHIQSQTGGIRYIASSAQDEASIQKVPLRNGDKHLLHEFAQSQFLEPLNSANTSRRDL